MRFLLIVPFLVAAVLAADAAVTVRPNVMKKGLDPYDPCCANWVWTIHARATEDL